MDEYSRSGCLLALMVCWVNINLFTSSLVIYPLLVFERENWKGYLIWDIELTLSDICPYGPT